MSKLDLILSYNIIAVSYYQVVLQKIYLKHSFLKPSCTLNGLGSTRQVMYFAQNLSNLIAFGFVGANSIKHV